MLDTTHGKSSLIYPLVPCCTCSYLFTYVERGSVENTEMLLRRGHRDAVRRQINPLAASLRLFLQAALAVHNMKFNTGPTIKSTLTSLESDNFEIMEKQVRLTVITNKLEDLKGQTVLLQMWLRKGALTCGPHD